MRMFAKPLLWQRIGLLDRCFSSGLQPRSRTNFGRTGVHSPKAERVTRGWGTQVSSVDSVVTNGCIEVVALSPRWWLHPPKTRPCGI